MTNTASTDTAAHDRMVSDFPAMFGDVVTERHARLCREEGHKTWERDGVDVGSCPRCGEVTAPVVRPLAEVLGEHVAKVQAQRDAVPAHQRPDSCHVCGSAATASTGRPACAHDWTNAEAYAEADARDRRTTVTYSGGQHTAEAVFVDETRGR